MHRPRRWRAWNIQDRLSAEPSFAQHRGFPLPHCDGRPRQQRWFNRFRNPEHGAPLRPDKSRVLASPLLPGCIPMSCSRTSGISLIHDCPIAEKLTAAKVGHRIRGHPEGPTDTLA